MPRGRPKGSLSPEGYRTKNSVLTYDCGKCGGKVFRVTQAVTYIINVETDEVFFEGQKPPRLYCVICRFANQFSILRGHPILEKLFALVETISRNQLQQDFTEQTKLGRNVRSKLKEAQQAHRLHVLKKEGLLDEE